MGGGPLATPRTAPPRPLGRTTLRTTSRSKGGARRDPGHVWPRARWSASPLPPGAASSRWPGSTGDDPRSPGGRAGDPSAPPGRSHRPPGHPPPLHDSGPAPEPHEPGAGHHHHPTGNHMTDTPTTPGRPCPTDACSCSAPARPTPPTGAARPAPPRGGAVVTAGLLLLLPVVAGCGARSSVSRGVAAVGRAGRPVPGSAGIRCGAAGRGPRGESLVTGALVLGVDPGRRVRSPGSTSTATWSTWSTCPIWMGSPSARSSGTWSSSVARCGRWWSRSPAARSGCAVGADLGGPVGVLLGVLGAWDVPTVLVSPAGWKRSARSAGTRPRPGSGPSSCGRGGPTRRPGAG